MAKIMVADDEAGIRALVSITLRDDDRYQLLQASDGADALRLAQRERPDVIFLDIMMPGVDGYQVCTSLKNNPDTSHAKVVMLTSLAGTEDRRRAIDAGADDFFAKPFSPIKLLEKVDDLLAKTDRRGRRATTPRHPTVGHPSRKVS